MAGNINFGLFGDLQYWDGDVYKDRHFRNSLQKISACQRVFNSFSLDFVVDLGDLIDRDWQSYDTILPAFKHFNAPVFHVLGNHDYEVDESFKAQVPEKIGLEIPYYRFEYNGYFFIVLDGNEISTFANPADTKNYVLAEEWLKKMEYGNVANANFWNGGIGNEQLNWLENELNHAQHLGKKVIIFCHYPIFPDDRHNLLNSHALLQLIQAYSCVQAWFCGHNHEGNYAQISGIHFVNILGMVETEHEPAFCVVEISEQTLKISGFGREPSRKLYLR